MLWCVFFLIVASHEFGHAIVGLMLRCTIYKIQIGTITTIMLNDIPFFHTIGIGIVPLTGYTSFAWSIENLTVLGKIAVASAGLVVNTCLGLLSTLVWMFKKNDRVGRGKFFLYSIVSLLYVITNIIPYDHSDGDAIFTLLKLMP